MTANDAYFELIKVYPQFNIVACYEYDSRFVFEIRQNGVESDEPQFDSLISVDKTIGEVGVFNPMDIPLEEYKAGVQVKDWKKGGAKNE